jgi:alkyl hydroperoxide reductase subunit AhpC
MSLQIGDQVPDFTASTTEGTINFHEWIGDGWAVLFSHPKDFTPVCTTELGAVAGLADEFARRNCKLMGLSVDSVEDHVAWKQDIADATGSAVNYPMVGDTDLAVAKAFGMLPNAASGRADERTAVDNQTVRSLFIIGPDKMIKLMLTYPMTTGRNFLEVLRVLDSIQLTHTHKVATPANWNQGDNVIIVPSVSNEEAAAKYPRGWETPKPYLRIVAQPE